ncbi:PorV/PorQ family protein [Candidatus Neomarinimicrobiota bacterium]
MKKCSLVRILIVVIMATGAYQAQAQDEYRDIAEYEKLGQCSMTFLDIDVGARSVGMGGVYTCIDNDVNAMFGNLAGIAGIKGGALSLSNTQWIADINQYGLAAAFGTGKFGTFGLSFVYFDNGELERTIPTKDLEVYPEGFYTDGTFTVNQWVAGLAYGRQITNKFSVGGQVKYCYEDLGTTDIKEPTFDDSTGLWTGYELIEDAENINGIVAFDFGTLYYFGLKDLRIGMSLRNFSQEVTYAFETFSLPINYRIAVAMNVLSLVPGIEHHDLQLSIATVSPYDGGERIHLGGEYKYLDLISFRAGYRSNTDVGAFSAGFGLSPNAFGSLGLQFDYAYSETDRAIGAIHRYTLGFSF